MESVWDYPRPPRLEPSGRHIRVVFAGQVVAETTRSLRVLETSHPPVYYIPREDVRMEFVEERPGRRSWCEFKGAASYWNVRVGPRVAREAAWSYEQPAPAYAAIRGHLAFYPDRADECTVDGERVRPQEGGFYGGWITADIQGPFKGGPGSAGW